MEQQDTDTLENPDDNQDSVRSIANVGAQQLERSLAVLPQVNNNEAE